MKQLPKTPFPRSRSHWLCLLGWASLILTLAACTRPLNPSATDLPAFLPPTVAPAPTATLAPVLPTAAPTQSPDCTDVLSFIQDLTIPDGMVVAREASMDKRWEVLNSGTCGWDDRYRLKLIAGPELGAATEQALVPARAGAHATIQVSFVAPTEPGDYRSAWQAFNPAGEPFGDPIFIEIRVE